MAYLYTGHHEQGLLLVSGKGKNTTGVVQLDDALGTSGTETFTMSQFIRLHSLVEKSLSMQETATEFVNFFLRNEGPFNPCQKWRMCCLSVPCEDKYSYSNVFAYIKMRELVMSHNLFANPGGWTCTSFA